MARQSVVTVTPTTVNNAGTRLRLIVPDLATTGEVRFADTDASSGLSLQIVPVIRSVNGLPGGQGFVDVFGSGFMEGASTISIGGVTFDDVYTNDTQSVVFDGDVTGSRNSAIRLLRPLTVENFVRIETAGGSFEYQLPRLDRPSFVEFDSAIGSADAGQPADEALQSVNAGQTITLFGRGFNSGTRVQFTAVDPAGVSGVLTRGGTVSADGTQLTTTVPSLASTGPLVVVGSDTVVNLQVVPTLLSVGGPVSSGNTIVVEGTGLIQGQYTLTVDGQAVVAPTVRTTTNSGGIGQQTIVFTVPDGVTNGLIQVATAGGTATLRADVATTELADVESGEVLGTAGDLIGDTLATAQGLTLPVDSQLAIPAWINQANDVDLYQLNLNRGDLIRVNVQGSGAGIGSLSDSYLRLFDSTGVELVADNSSGAGNDSLLVYQISESGTYTLGVSGDNNRAYDPAVTDSGDNGFSEGLYRLLIERLGEGINTISGITSTSDSGTPTVSNVPSANVGQTITLTGRDLLTSDRVVFTRTNNDGTIETITVNPASVATDGSSLDAVVPNDAASGSVRLERQTTGIFLQVVPMLTNIDQSEGRPFHNGSMTLTGTGFTEGAISVLFGDQALADVARSTNPLDVRFGAIANGRINLTVPSDVPTGPIRVSTLGGTSEAFGTTFDSVIGIADSGTPADSAIPSANPGQIITLAGTDLSSTTEVVFEVIDSAGNRTEQIVRPTAVAEDGTSAEVLVPINAFTATIGVVGDQNNTQALLQIVPIINSVDLTSINGTSGAVSVQLRGDGFVEGNDSQYAFGGEVLTDLSTSSNPIDVRFRFEHENDSVQLTVPTLGDFAGPITVTTAGGTSAPLSFDFDSIVSTATSGTAADSEIASANPGQTVTITGSSWTDSTDLLTSYTDSSGTIRYEILNPNFVNAEGTEATFIVPDRYNGLFTVQRAGASQTHQLQVVPRLDSFNINGTGRIFIDGAGLLENNGSQYTFSGGTLTDAGDNTIDVRFQTSHDNDGVQLNLPVQGLGNLTVTTTGGTSAPLQTNFIHPGLGDLRDVAFDETDLWVASRAGELRRVSLATGGIAGNL